MKLFRFLWHTLLRGLAIVLPLALTFYITYWFLFVSETALLKLMRALFPGPGDPPYYFPGMGILAALVLTFAVGILARAYLFKLVIKFINYLFTKIPLLRSLYGGLKDVADMLANQDHKKKLNSVVLVDMGNEMRLLGFITCEDMQDLADGMGDGEKDDVAVYLPLSYQVGGYLVIMPRSRLQPVDIPVDEALRFALTAGMSAHGEATGAGGRRSSSSQAGFKLIERIRRRREAAREKAGKRE